MCPHVQLEDQLARQLLGKLRVIREGIQRYFDAGVDTAFLLLQSSEPDPTRRRAQLRSAMRALAPSGSAVG